MFACVCSVTLTPIPKDYISRYLGMAIIPGQHVVKVYAEGGVEDCV